jgi:hypothetical protein
MNILWKIKRKVRNTLIARSNNPRPSSRPFISGDTFRSIADHIYESGRENPDGKGRSFAPTEVKKGDIIFVDGALIEEYFSKIHPHIQEQYKLITHNNDWNITEKEIAFIDDKIIHWFAQNVLVSHTKVTPIPIGLENVHFANAGHLPFYAKATSLKKIRLPRILIGFNVASNVRVREPALKSLLQNPHADRIEKMAQDRYVSLVKKYSFVASPAGNGEDCIRTWESMLLGAVPIVTHSVGIAYFKNLGLPLWIVDSWDELEKMSEYDLSQKYDLITSQADRKPLYMDYWENMIQSKI